MLERYNGIVITGFYRNRKYGNIFSCEDGI
jgi:hypothetical protein